MPKHSLPAEPAADALIHPRQGFSKFPGAEPAAEALMHPKRGKKHGMMPGAKSISHGRNL